MKRMYTRFLALVMALAMVLSCTATASAAEVDVTDESSVVYTVATTGNEGVMPLSDTFGSWSGVVSSSSSASGHFSLSSARYVKCAYNFVYLDDYTSSTTLTLIVKKDGKNFGTYFLTADAKSHNFEFATGRISDGYYTWELKTLFGRVNGQIVFYEP